VFGVTRGQHVLSLFFFLARLNLSFRPEERPNPDTGTRQQAAQCPFPRGAALLGGNVTSLSTST
jgi:hypothetical protein